MRQEGVTLQDPDLPVAGRTRPQDQPTGTLSYLDMDTLLSLAHYWHIGGNSSDGTVDLTFPEVLRWMGFSHLAGAPYRTLRASLHRLRLCRLSVWNIHEAHLDGVAANTGSLLSSVSLEVEKRPGAPVRVHAQLSRMTLEWMQEMQTQDVDLDIVAYLARHTATRRLPLARVLYVHLAAWRKRDGSFDLPEGWLADLYADRNPEKPNQKLYLDAFHKRSKVARALIGLAKANAVVLRRDVDSGRITGRFQCPDGVPRLRDIPRQRRLFALDTMAIAEAAARGDPEPAAALIEHQATTDPTTDPERRRRLLDRCRVASDVVRDAAARGWSAEAIDRVFVAALYGQHLGSVRTPAAWAATRLRKDDPAAWSADAIREHLDVGAARAWAAGPGGPLAAE